MAESRLLACIFLNISRVKSKMKGMERNLTDARGFRGQERAVQVLKCLQSTKMTYIALKNGLGSQKWSIGGLKMTLTVQNEHIGSSKHLQTSPTTAPPLTPQPHKKLQSYPNDSLHEPIEHPLYVTTTFLFTFSYNTFAHTQSSNLASYIRIHET